MNESTHKKIRHFIFSFILLSIPAFCVFFCGCTSGYSNDSLFPDDVRTVCLEMFDNRSFRRGVEYELSDALSKRIEAQTPYKILSNPNQADTLISGQITQIGISALTAERQTGRTLEKEVQLTAVVNWKNLKTGQLLLDSESITATASYSQWQNQGFDYASTLAANNLAEKIVEAMEKKW